jgi:DNA-binding NarL/FixJ family response regulator
VWRDQSAAGLSVDVRPSDEDEVNRAIAVLVVDPFPLARQGLSRVILDEPGFELSAAVGTVARAVASAARTTSDMVIVEPLVAPRQERQLLERLRAAAPNVPILILSARCEPKYVRSLMDQGASGFISKEQPVASLLRTIREVLRGERPILGALGS